MTLYTRSSFNFMLQTEIDYRAAIAKSLLSRHDSHTTNLLILKTESCFPVDTLSYVSLASCNHFLMQLFSACFESHYIVSSNQ